MSRRARWVLLVVGALLAAGCGASTPPPPTVRLDRGDVVSVVKATGSVVAVSQQKLAFRNGGKVVAVDVKVGDRVEKGQVLARLDDSALRQTLAQRQATLDQQQAVLGRNRGDRSVSGAGDSLEQAKKIQQATEDEAARSDAANESATDRARAELRTAQSARDLADAQLRAARAACRAGTPCDTSSAQSAVQQADSAAVSAKSKVDAAEHAEDTGRAAGNVSIENARKGVVSAQNDRASASSDRPFNIAEQQAKVADAQAGVASARRDVDQTVLIAPSSGVVAAINGAAGEFLPEPGAVTSQSPGGGAPIPETTDPTGAGTFMVLTAADAYELVVAFEESDAAQLVVGQQVDITVDAVPGPPRPGRLLAIAPTGQDQNGIVTFNTTISIEGGTDRLRNGMTADAAVRTRVATNVLRVPTAAIGRTGGKPSVTVTGPDGDPATITFEPGLVGDQFTEVRSGLTVGQDVDLPQATVTTGPARPRRGGRGPGG